MLIFVALIQNYVELKQKSMEQLKEYLWTESIPLVFVLAFMAAMPMITKNDGENRIS